MPEKDIRALFGKYDIKFTKQRCAIYNILVKAEQPMTVEDIFLECKNSGIDASLSTIYRILDLFLGKKVVTSAGNDGKKATYELNMGGHKHCVICLKCKKKIIIDECPFEKYEKSLSQSTNFDIIDHKLDIYGYCPSCKPK